MISLGAQQVNRPDAYLQMLGDSALVKAVSLAGELDFTVQRLVRDAEQRAVGDAEAIAPAAMVALSISIATARLRLKRSAEAE